MRVLALLLLVSACGANVRHKVEGKVALEPPKEPVKVEHVFSIDESVFIDSCEKKFETIPDLVERDKRVDECVQNNKAIVEQLIATLNGQQK